MPKRSNEGRRRLCEIFTAGGAGSETWVDGRSKPSKKLLVRFGRGSSSGVATSGGQGAGDGKGGASDGSRSEAERVWWAGMGTGTGTGMGGRASASEQFGPMSPSGVVGGLGMGFRPALGCWWSRLAMWVSIMTARTGRPESRDGSRKREEAERTKAV